MTSPWNYFRKRSKNSENLKVKHELKKCHFLIDYTSQVLRGMHPVPLLLKGN